MAELICLEQQCGLFLEADSRLHDAIDERTADETMQNRAKACEAAGICTLAQLLTGNPYKETENA